MTAGVASNLVVRGNAAHGENSKGGGVYVSSGAVFSDSVVSNNTCTGSGGGLYADGSLDLSRCLVAGNRSTGPGGGLYACAKVNVTGCTFADNTASNGGGVQFSGAEGSRISFSHLVGNSATSYGGGIGIQDAAVSVSDCLIQKNTASYRGGGIDGYGASGSTIDRCVIDSNSASNEGGGVISDDVMVRNCLVVSNRTYTAGGGGGVYSHGGVTIENCTVVDNNSGVEGQQWATIRNSIIWRNGSENLNASATISDSCIGGYSGAGTRVIADNPKLTKDFHLKASSPCVNKGANLSYTVDSLDLARQPRIHVFDNRKYNVCDMGCYESLYFGPTGLVIFLQ